MLTKIDRQERMQTLSKTRDTEPWDYTEKGQNCKAF